MQPVNCACFGSHREKASSGNGKQTTWNITNLLFNLFTFATVKSSSVFWNLFCSCGLSWVAGSSCSEFLT